MFKSVIFFVALVTIATALPAARQNEKQAEDEPIAIIKSERSQEPDGSFSFSYETADGSAREETGSIINPNTDEEAVEVSGSYRYYDADGQLVEVTYTAGKDGFVPSGTNIPSEITAAAQAAAEAASEK